MQERAHFHDPLHFLAQRRAPAVELLAQRHRNRILQVRAAHLQYVVEFPALGEERLLQPAQRFHVAVEAEDQRQAERRRIDVVGRLPEVHVIVRVDELVLAFLMAETLERQVGDHLVRVHVGRRSGAALDEIGDELVAHLAGDQPVARAGDGVGNLRVEHAEVAIRERRGLFHVAERLDEVGLQRHRDARDVEVLLPAQRLHAVIRVRRNLLLAEEVLFDPNGHDVAPGCSLTCLNLPPEPRPAALTARKRTSNLPVTRHHCRRLRHCR